VIRAAALQPFSERRAALEARFPTWEPRTLAEVFDAAVARFSDRPLVITDDVTYTYRAIQEWSERVAHGLVSAGVQPGEHVAIVLGNQPEFVAVKLGIARAGAVAVPINFLNRRDELGYVLEQSDAVALITMDSFRGVDHLNSLDELIPGWEHTGGARLPKLRNIWVVQAEGSGRSGAATLADLASSSDGWHPVDGFGPDSPLDILYTSGTTGTPKGVVLTHDMFMRTAYGSAYGRAFEDGRRISFSLPMYHVFGYVEGLLAVLFVGGAIIPQLHFDPVATLDSVVAHQATDLLLVPIMTQAVITAARSRDANAWPLSALASIMSSGGVSPSGIWEDILEVFGPVEVTTGYGMSETTASTTVTRMDDTIETWRTKNGRLRDVGVAGDPANGGRLCVYRVVDPATGLELPRGEIGELMVRGIGVTAGYYNKPEENDLAFDDDGWLRTGDLGTLDDDDYITLAGRRKECYRCGGEQVMPAEVEAVLTTHPAVAQAHVVPVLDERMGEAGFAWVVPADGVAVDHDALIAHCAERLARFKVPKYVRTLNADHVPLTPSGRPRKFLLAERASEELGIA
jgi:fatty-acyl-CoA synthase